jgi:hypothetical protein
MSQYNALIRFLIFKTTEARFQFAFSGEKIVGLLCSSNNTHTYLGTDLIGKNIPLLHNKEGRSFSRILK